MYFDPFHVFGYLQSLEHVTIAIQISCHEGAHVYVDALLKATDNNDNIQRSIDYTGHISR